MINIGRVHLVSGYCSKYWFGERDGNLYFTVTPGALFSTMR
jgi:hypothetical protein